MIAHIVLFEPKAELSDADRGRFLQELRRLVASVDGVEGARIGQTFSVGQMPNIVGGSTYSFAAVLEFADRAALQRYLDHPSHDELRRLFWASCAATVIADAEMFAVDSSEADLLVR